MLLSLGMALRPRDATGGHPERLTWQIRGQVDRFKSGESVVFASQMVTIGAQDVTGAGQEVTWTADVPDCMALSPASGSLAVPAGGRASQPVSVQSTGTSAGTYLVQIHQQAPGGMALPLSSRWTCLELLQQPAAVIFEEPPRQPLSTPTPGPGYGAPERATDRPSWRRPMQPQPERYTNASPGHHRRHGQPHWGWRAGPGPQVRLASAFPPAGREDRGRVRGCMMSRPGDVSHRGGEEFI